MNLGSTWIGGGAEGWAGAADLHILAVSIHLFKNCSAGVSVGRTMHVPAGVVMTLLQLCQLRIGPTEASFI